MTKNSIKAVGWFILSLITSTANDAITKILSQTLNSCTIAFWRFFFSVILLLPVVFYHGIKSLQTKKIFIHVARGVILAIAIALWIFGIHLVPISTVTLISFTIPMFTIIMASIFLKERVNSGTIFATIMGFIGSLFTLSPSTISVSFISLIFIIASILFAILDILNKILLSTQEKTLPMMFYSNTFSAICIFLIAQSTQNTSVQVINNIYNILLLIILGLGANLILFFIIKAFSLAKASLLAPIRYIELIFSTSAGFIFFDEKLSWNILIGGVIILLSSFFIDRRVIQ